MGIKAPRPHDRDAGLEQLIRWVKGVGVGGEDGLLGGALCQHGEQALIPVGFKAAMAVQLEVIWFSLPKVFLDVVACPANAETFSGIDDFATNVSPPRFGRLCELVIVFGGHLPQHANMDPLRMSGLGEQVGQRVSTIGVAITGNGDKNGWEGGLPVR